MSEVNQPAITVPPAAPAPQAAQFDVAAYLRQLGLSDSAAQDPKSVLDAIINYNLTLEQELDTLKPLAQLGQEFSPHAETLRQVVATGKTGGQQANDTPKPVDPRYMAFLTRGEDGFYRAMPEYPHMQQYANQANAWQDHQRSTIEKMIVNPRETIGLDEWWEEKQKAIEEMFTKGFDDRMDKYRAEEEASRFWKESQKDFIELGPDGKPVVDPITRQPKFTSKGSEFNKYLIEAAELGISDEAAQRRYAQRMIERTSAAAQTVPQGQAAVDGQPATPAVPDDKRNAFLDRVRDNARSVEVEHAGGNAGSETDHSGVNLDRLAEKLTDNALRENGLIPRNTGE